jgi:hypothetical protein
MSLVNPSFTANSVITLGKKVTPDLNGWQVTSPGVVR